MRRRDFIISIGGAAAAWPLAARAQQAPMPVIGLLSGRALKQSEVTAFRKGLAEAGYVEGRTVAIEYRSADNQYDRLPALAAELVRQEVAVIAAPDTTSGALAAKAATKSIPIVFGTGADPVQAGLVASLNRPGGNVTGVTRLSTALGPKRLELLRELAPAAAVIGMLVNPANPSAKTQIREGQEATTRMGVRLVALPALSESDFDVAFTTFLTQQIGALLVANDTLFFSRRDELVALAARHAVPAMYSYPDYVSAGGLMSYSASMIDSDRQVGIYTARILKGEKPADLPVMQPTKFDLVINLKTAKALGLEIPAKLLALADEMIE